MIVSALAILKQWFFEGDDTLEQVLRCGVERVGRTRFGERFKLSYAFRAKSPSSCESYAQRKLGAVPPDADWVVHQEAYYDVRDGKVAWMIVLCGGYQPVGHTYSSEAGYASEAWRWVGSLHLDDLRVR